MSLDEQLQKIAAGDYAAFDEFYLATKGAVYYVALSVLKERSLAEDAMQSAYLKALRSAGSYKHGTSPVAWICKIARNQALDIRRKRSREHLVDAAENEYLFPSYEADGYGNLIDLARRTLKEGEFAVVMLVAQGYKRREISHMLSIPVPTVTWRYNAAIKKLKIALGN